MDPSKIKDIVDKHRGCASEYHIIPIPEHKAHNARISLNIPSDDQIFALVDFTFFGFASEAMVVAEKGLYWKNKGESEAKHLFWIDFAQYTPSEKLGFLSKSISFRPGLEIDLAGAGTLSTNDNPIILQLLNDLKTLAHGNKLSVDSERNSGLVVCEFCQGEIKPDVTYCKHCGIKLRG